MKMNVRDVRIKVGAQYRRAGSILAGSATAGCDGIRTELSLDCDEPRERVIQLIRMAEASCYTIGTVRNPTPCEIVATVNGEEVEIPPE